jgi:YidC/Oxa1 family membrane protein insertase
VFQWERYAALLPQAHDASIFGVPLYATFMHADETPSPMNTRVLALIMIALMTATTFTTQRQLIVKNSAPDNPMVRQQKILLYVFPLIFAVSGINFPIGVLIYWFTTNLWSMGQQFWVIRNNPQPGTPAHDAKVQRTAAKLAAKAGPEIEAIPAQDSDTASESAARAQPKRTSRSQRKKKPQ